MENENKTKKLNVTPDFILKCSLYVILGVYVILMAIGKFIFNPQSLFWRSLNIFGNAGEFNPVIRIISYIIFLLGLSWISRLAIKFISKPFHKGKAIIDMLCSLIKYTAFIVLAFYILKTVGVDTNAILAGIGIIGLIVGLGAQPLITDIIAGFFIVFEKIFDVGDIIVVDGFRGTVSEIGIRTTKIIDAGGNIKNVNNSDLKNVINMTNQLSLAICDVSIEYGESLERVEAVLKENMDSIKAAIPAIKDGPYYKGVAELGDSGVTIRFVANCEEDSKYQVERDLNRQFKLLFDRNNINIPFPQIVLNQPVSFEEATKFHKQQAEKFVEEQKEISKGIADSELNHF